LPVLDCPVSIDDHSRTPEPDRLPQSPNSRTRESLTSYQCFRTARPETPGPSVFSQVQDCPSEAPQISAFITVLRPARARPARESQLLSLFCDRAGLDLPESQLLSPFCDRIDLDLPESQLLSLFWRSAGLDLPESQLLSLFCASRAGGQRLSFYQCFATAPLASITSECLELSTTSTRQSR